MKEEVKVGGVLGARLKSTHKRGEEEYYGSGWPTWCREQIPGYIILNSKSLIFSM